MFGKIHNFLSVTLLVNRHNIKNNIRKKISDSILPVGTAAHTAKQKRLTIIFSGEIDYRMQAKTKKNKERRICININMINHLDCSSSPIIWILERAVVPPHPDPYPGVAAAAAIAARGAAPTAVRQGWVGEDDGPARLSPVSGCCRGGG